MPPKVKITKEDIINTAVSIIRKHGADALNARAVADRLSCSTQPIFSNFSTMEMLQNAVLEYADMLYNEYTDKELKAGKYPAYKATGVAYIRFAREEKELFKLLFMRDRKDDAIIPAFSKSISDIVEESTGLNKDKAKLFHLEMWIFVHGIATMTATNFLELDEALISELTSDAYFGIKKRYEEKE